jgi:hypothetical protein
MPRENSMVCVYKTHTEAEAAVKTLQTAGFGMKKLSIVGKDYHTEEHPFGSAFFLIPGIGPLVVAGPLVSWIVGALEGAAVVGGLSALGAGLYSIGIPKDSVVKYETAIKSGSFLLLAHGTAAYVSRAKETVSSTRPVEATEHFL